MSKILVIEDETYLREDIEEMLKMEGFQVITAADGVEGVNSALRHQPDLIICDIMMPRLDGYEVLQDIRANSLTQFVPFIFLTAKAARDDLRAGMALGADDYLVKPFERLDLLHAIQTRLDKKAALDEEHREQLSQFKSMLAHERGQRMLTEKLTALFSDEFRNPVSSILTFAGFLQDGSAQPDDERKAMHAKRIEILAHHVLDLLDDMLIVGQMENGTLRYMPELVNAGQFFGAIANAFQMMSGDANPIVYESDFDGIMTADSRLLRQIGVNLIANAIQSSSVGGTVQVTLNHDDVGLRLTVQDAGGNIPEAEQVAMLDVIQGGVSGNSVAEAQLGLAIARQAVELHGGTMDVDYQPGLGTTVVVSIPHE